MSYKKHIAYILLPVGMLLLFGCKDDEQPIFLVGEWNIDTYEVYYEENGEVITDLRYEDAGEFIFKESGTGNATIATPGSSLPQNQLITWFYDEEEKQLTIDYDTMEGPIVYETEVVTLSEMKWLSIFNGTITTITVSKVVPD
ncbi:MAG: hypothetical protein ACNS64_13150 [Candidatus Halalkalibacterium sp. M3_1C_030]